MGYRLNVAKKYVIEYADIEAFNWKILEFHALLGNTRRGAEARDSRGTFDGNQR